jgi:hypothetical protein
MSHLYFVVYALYDARGFRGESNDAFATPEPITRLEHIRALESEILAQHSDQAVKAVVIAPPLQLQPACSQSTHEHVYLTSYAVLGRDGRREEFSTEAVVEGPLTSITQIRYIEELLTVRHLDWAHQVNVISCPMLLRIEEVVSGLKPQVQQHT